MDTIRTLQQTSTNFSYILPFRKYFAGIGPSIAITTPAFTLYLVAYRQTKKELTPYIGPSSFSNYIISGSVAELASSFVWTPMEVLKGRMQISQTANQTTAGLIRSIYHNEGPKGFFRGYWMGIAVFLPHSVVWWTTYESIKMNLIESVGESNMGPLQYGISSAGASTAACTISNFLDVVKTRQQLAVADEISSLRPSDSMGVFQVARNLIHEVGLTRALLKGLHIRLLLTVPSGCLTMILVESIRPDLPSDQVAYMEKME